MKKTTKVEKPYLLVEYGKYGEIYFLINSPEGLRAAALKILRRKFENSYLEDYSKEIVGYQKKIVKDIPENLPPDLIKHIKNENLEIKKEIKWINRNTEQYKAGKKALKDKDGKTAWQICQERNDGQYERIATEQFENL